MTSFSIEEPINFTTCLYDGTYRVPQFWKMSRSLHAKWNLDQLIISSSLLGIVVCCLLYRKTHQISIQVSCTVFLNPKSLTDQLMRADIESKPNIPSAVLYKGDKRCIAYMSHMEQELLILPEDLSSPPVLSVARSLVFRVRFVDHCLSFYFWPLLCLFFD
jgi:hypothetical protein